MGEWETSSHKNFPKTQKNNLTIKRQDVTALVYFFSRKQGREGGDVKHSLAGYLSPPAINGYQAAIMGVVYGTHIQDMDLTNNHHHNQLLNLKEKSRNVVVNILMF